MFFCFHFVCYFYFMFIRTKQQILILISTCFLLSFYDLLFRLVVLSEEYDDDYMDDDHFLLPEFPLQEPATFQILESDCKLNQDVVHQLRHRFHLFANTENDLQHFLTANLRAMLTDKAASVYSWNGLQGNIAIMNFKIIDILIGEYYFTLMVHLVSEHIFFQSIFLFIFRSFIEIV